MSAPLASPRTIGSSGTNFLAAGLRRGGQLPLYDAGFIAAPGELTVLYSTDTSGQALLRAAIGIDPVEHGSSSLHGVTMSRGAHQPNTLTPIRAGVLAATPFDFEGRTVATAIGQWLDHLPELDRRERVHHVAESLGFGGLGHARVLDLPLALQHRIAMARALAVAPAMIAAEDPFCQLPERDRNMLEGLLRVIAADFGVPVVYAASAATSATRAHHVIRLEGGVVTADVRGWTEIRRLFAAA